MKLINYVWGSGQREGAYPLRSLYLSLRHFVSLPPSQKARATFSFFPSPYFSNCSPSSLRLTFPFTSPSHVRPLIAGEIVPRRNRTQEKSYPYWMGTISLDISYPGYDFSRDIVPRVRLLQRYRTLREKFYHHDILINLYRQYTFRSYKATWAGLNVFF